MNKSWAHSWSTIITLAVLAIFHFVFESLAPAGKFLGLNLHLITWSDRPSILIFFLVTTLVIVTLLQKFGLKLSVLLLKPIFYGLILVVLSPQPLLTLFLIFVLILFYHFSNSASPKKSLIFLSVVVSVFWLLNYYVFLRLDDFSTVSKFFFIFIKASLMMRLISWVIDRKVYLRRTNPSLLEYLEYLLFPAFFIMPGQIQFVQYTYFHQSKTSSFHFSDAFNLLKLTLWGFVSLSLFFQMDKFFWQSYNSIPMFLSQYGQFLGQLAIGFYWLIAVYFLQASGCAIQVPICRCFGYNLKYDMHWPLLTRTPIEYLKNHSSYIKDYVVDVGYKPLSLFFFRKFKVRPRLRFVIAIISYAVIIGLQSGLRPDYDRGLVVSTAMIGFLTLFLFYEKFILIVTPSSLRPAGTMSLESQNSIKRIAQWRHFDYFFWLINIFILSFYKAILGMAMSLYR